MNYSEEPVRFPCAQETLFGILARPERSGAVGVVVVVGGPQTRIGSHRQFVLLARRLAAAGYACLRFDSRGMGDSTGEQRGFDDIDLDIAAAVDCLKTACPSVDRVVLWGLCDAASAALLYCDARRDARVAGLCLLNPWVRSEASLAKTQVKHYYGQRLLQKEFWIKLLSGRLNVARSVAELLAKLGQAASSGAPAATQTFQERMAQGWRGFPGRILLILSGDDYTAKEFLEYAGAHPAWEGLLAAANCQRVDMAAADHTFSSNAWRDSVENTCLDWLNSHA